VASERYCPLSLKSSQQRIPTRFTLGITLKNQQLFTTLPADRYALRMKVPKKLLLLLLSATVSLLCTDVLAADPQGDSRPAFTIGAILPLTGPAANLAEIARRGIELALNDLSPEDRARTKVIIEDDGMVNARSVSAARKLVSVDKVDAVITWSSGTAQAVKGITDPLRIPHLAIASDPRIAQDRKFSFTYWALPEIEAEALHEYLARSGPSRVALLSLTHPGVLAVRDAFTAIAKKSGKVLIVADEEVVGDLTDFRGVLNRIKLKGEIDVFIPLLFPGQLAISIRQARELGISAKLFGFETFEDMDEFKASNGLLAGGIYATGADPTSDFIQKFQAKWPNSSYYTANQSYDAVKLLVAATRESKDGRSIVAFLQNLKEFPTASGVISSREDNRFSLPVVVKRIGSNGGPEDL
jgi:branched-chain amino acid transport system substrate-binding protein